MYNIQGVPEIDVKLTDNNCEKKKTKSCTFKITIYKIPSKRQPFVIS